MLEGYRMAAEDVRDATTVMLVDEMIGHLTWGPAV